MNAAITIIKATTPSVLCKRYSKVDGKVKKVAVAHVTEGTCRTLSAATVQDMVRVLTEVTQSTNLCVVPGVWRGAGSEPFDLVTEKALHKLLSLPKETRVEGGVHLHGQRRVGARLKRGITPSGWMLIDADDPPGIPDAWAAMTLPERLVMMEKLIPGISRCERIELRGSSARVVNGSGIGGVATHAWVRVNRPDKIETLKARVAVEMVNRGLAFPSPRYSRREPDKVIGNEQRTVIDLSVWTTGRIVFNARPDLGAGMDAYTVVDAGITIVNEGAGELDISGVKMPDLPARREYQKRTGIKLSVNEAGGDGEGAPHIISEGELTLDTEITRRGTTKPLSEWVEKMKPGEKLRCEAPFRRSESEAAFIRLCEDGVPIVHDVGISTTFRLASLWPEVREIKADLPPVPPFDGTALLPPILRDFVLDEADRMPCSPDYIAAALIVALGSVIGARAALKPKRRDDWIVTPNLFGGVVGDPASKKTPAIGTVMRFLDRLEAKQSEILKEKQKVFEGEKLAHAAHQAAIAAAMKKAASGSKADAPAMAAAVADMTALEAPEEPTVRRFRTSDATVAKLGDMLSKNPAGMLVFRDELVGLLASWDREGNEGDRTFYLEGWNGTGSYSIDRVGRGSLLVPNLCLGVFGGVQPDLLEKYLGGIVNSMDNDGRIQRFQVLVFPDATAWEWRDRYPVKGAREAVRDAFDRLAEFDPVLDGAAPANDFVKLPHFHLSDAAQELFIEWSQALYGTKIAAESNSLMRQHLAKFEKLFCALALILHLAEGVVAHEVGVDAALRAAAWCDYLEAHARRVYALVEVGQVNTARMLGRRLAEKKLVDGFTARDVVRKGWAGMGSSAQAEMALAVLEEHGWVVGDESSEASGRPTTRFNVNPGVYTKGSRA